MKSRELCSQMKQEAFYEENFIIKEMLCVDDGATMAAPLIRPPLGPCGQIFGS